MASVYSLHLPGAFPIKMQLNHESVAECVEALLGYEAGGNGSSFAVTSDTLRAGQKHLWLSRVSYEFLASELLVPRFEDYEDPRHL